MRAAPEDTSRGPSTNAKLLVTGATGLVGTQIVLRGSGRYPIVGLGRRELDITDADAVQRAFEQHRPDAVLHCAAYTDVDGAERDPTLAFRVNATGAEHVAKAAQSHGTWMIYVSTDYVFDGTAASPYRTDETLSPLSSYGKSKLEGERRAASICPDRHTIVRTGWLYGAGKGFVDWARSRFERDEEVQVVTNQFGSPTYARDLAEGLLRLADGTHRGIYHFVNKGEASWFDVGRAVASELGYVDARLTPITAEALERLAPRPSYSALDVSRYETETGAPIREWRVALSDYLAGK